MLGGLLLPKKLKCDATNHFPEDYGLREILFCAVFSPNAVMGVVPCALVILDVARKIVKYLVVIVVDTVVEM